MIQPGHAEIVGAGFGGLVAAIALAQRGWSVRVHERRAALQGEGYGIAIHKNMAHIFSEFGILDEVLAGGMKIDRRDSMDSHGNVVMRRKTERSPFRIDREHIIALLAKRAREAGVEINSSIREALGLLRQRIWGRDCGVRVTIPRRPEEIAQDDLQGTFMVEAWADKRRVICCPVTKGEFYVLLTCTAGDTDAFATTGLFASAGRAENIARARELLHVQRRTHPHPISKTVRHRCSKKRGRSYYKRSLTPSRLASFTAPSAGVQPFYFVLLQRIS